MKLHGTWLPALALAMMLGACSTDDTASENGGPACVRKLETPRNNLHVSMLLLDPATFEGLRFEWEPADGEVGYELVFDKSGGDFSDPVASFAATESYRTLQLEEIQRLFDENVDAEGKSALLDWRVYTTSEAGRLPSTQTRTLELSTRAEVVVETLLEPANETLFNLEEMDDEATFGWSEPVWLGNDRLISYRLVIDRTGGDFSEPLLSLDVTPTDDAPAPTEASVSRQQLAELYEGSEVADSGDPCTLQWAVYARIDDQSRISAETRTFSIIPRKKIPPFAVGDLLYIAVPDSPEDGQQASFIDANYYRTDNDSWHDRMEKVGQNWEDFPYYEIFTRLETGQKYGFYTLNEKQEKARFFRATADNGFVETAGEEDSYATVGESGIYRIRFKADGTDKIDIRRIEYISLRFAWGSYDQNSYTEAMMTYAGKGLWTLPAYHIQLRDMGSYKEDRYRFILKLEGIESIQGLSKNNEGIVTGNRPGQNEDASYWHLQLSYTGWDHWVFKFPAWLCDDSNLGRWIADVRLYLNADKGHYTHEFVNPVEVKSFADGDPLYIDGSGTETGQKMSYMTDGYYNPDFSSLCSEIDAFKGQDYRYEIFTRIEGGSRFWFRSQHSDALYTLSADGTQIKRIDTTDQAEAPLSETGIYRIRFNIVSGTAYVARVESVAQFYCATGTKTAMTYEGKGLWSIRDFHIAITQQGWGLEERYKFEITLDGQAQPLGIMNSYGGTRPSLAATPQDYWYVQPALADGWEPSFKYPAEYCDEANLTRWYADLLLYMNDDKGHYTHEFANAHE